MSVDLSKCSDNHKVRRLLSDRNNIELQIKEIQPDALINYELEKLAEDLANEASTSHGKALDIDLVESSELSKVKAEREQYKKLWQQSQRLKRELIEKYNLPIAEATLD